MERRQYITFVRMAIVIRELGILIFVLHHGAAQKFSAGKLPTDYVAKPNAGAREA